MAYIYHMRQPDMQGKILYPLNTLNEIYPEIYTRQIAKYNDYPDRKKLPQKIIPRLNCLWNDVVQCSPVHPYLLYQALALRELSVNPALEFFQIPISEVGSAPLALFDDSASSNEDITDETVTLISPESYRELTAVPEATLKWYDRLASQGKRVFGHFVGVPHVMVQGPIEITEAKIIRWGEPPVC